MIRREQVLTVLSGTASRLFPCCIRKKKLRIYCQGRGSLTLRGDELPQQILAKTALHTLGCSFSTPGNGIAWTCSTQPRCMAAVNRSPPPRYFLRPTITIHHPPQKKSPNRHCRPINPPTLPCPINDGAIPSITNNGKRCLNNTKGGSEPHRCTVCDSILED